MTRTDLDILTRRAEMETKVHKPASDDAELSTSERGVNQLAGGTTQSWQTEGNGTGSGWFEPPRDADGAISSYHQLHLEMYGRSLGAEEQRQVQETLRCAAPFETESTLVELLRRRLDEWTAAMEAGDRLAAVGRAVLATHTLHRIAVDVDRASSQEAADKIRETAKWWTFEAVALLDSVRPPGY
jgi:hypothetical protein